MRVVVAATGMSVAHRFEQCSNLTIYTVTNGIVTQCQNIPNPGPPFEAVVQNLVDIDANTLITDTMLEDTAALFKAAGIEVVHGMSGNASEVIDRYLTHTFIGCY